MGPTSPLTVDGEAIGRATDGLPGPRFAPGRHIELPRRGRTRRPTHCSIKFRLFRWIFAAYRSPSCCAPSIAQWAEHDGLVTRKEARRG